MDNKKTKYEPIFKNDLSEEEQQKQNAAFMKEKEEKKKLERKLGIVDVLIEIIELITACTHSR